MTARYGVRRFCSPPLKGTVDRPDCFEVYDRTTGEAASFGLFKYQAQQVARAKNAEERAVRVITAEQAARLVAFAAEYGRMWKRTLNDKWFTGTDVNEPDGHLLRQVRNQFGPSWLVGASLDILTAAATAPTTKGATR